ncbi:MAG TPA: hypothetical protein VEI97_12120, partial [bacterium]|nr:hypothetical protein [bacterium]
RMFRLALSHLYLGRFEPPEEVLAGLRGVTTEMVQDFARRLFDPEGLGIGVVVPEGWSGADRCGEELQGLAAEL